MHSIHRALALALLAAGSSSALVLAPARPSLARPAACVHRAAAVAMQEEKPPTPGPPPSEAAVDLVERASDPFGIVRVIIYVTFGITGVAGIGTSLLQMGDDAGAAMGNLAINAGVLAAGVAVYFVDRSATAALREKAEKELANPYLKGGLIDGEEGTD